MKRLIYYIALFFSASLFYTACCKDNPTPQPTSATSSCQENKTTRNVSVNFFDFKSTSPYFNQVVANFKFSQRTSTYSGSASCPFMNCSTTLTIQNNTTRKISFDYNIVFNLNLAHWNYQGVATINAGSSVDIGQVTENCAAIDLGQILLQSTSISYQ